MEKARLTGGMFTSRTDEWGTPQALFNALNAEFQFTLDPCATADNCKCGKFYTRAEDGIARSWEGERVFCNPPYSAVKDWARKCRQEGQRTLVVMLVPARTDTAWFHDHVYGRAEIRFIRGRLKYNDQAQSAPFPSLLAIYRPD